MANEDLNSLVGSTIAARYRVRELLGAGSMGAVYAVVDSHTATDAALKILLPDQRHTPAVAARLAREAKTMTLLDHRNIVRFVDVGELDSRVFVVTELIRGVSLRALLDDGYIEPRRALIIVRQILEALAHAHARGVVHRDIKPENIMLVDGGSPDADEDLVKVLDFGVAKLFDDTCALLGEGKLTRAGQEMFGSPLYIAPESVLGRAIDGRTDLYSVGAVLFEMLAGRPPFDETDVMTLVRRHAASKAPTLHEAAPDRAFTPELERLVAEALEKRPELRFASATEMIGAVRTALHSLDPSTEIVAPLALVAATPATMRSAESAPEPLMWTPGTASVPAPVPSTATPERAAESRPQTEPAPPASIAPRPAIANLVSKRPPLRGWMRSKRGTAMRVGAISVVLLGALVALAVMRKSNAPARTAASSPIAPLTTPRLGDSAAEQLQRGHRAAAAGRGLDALAAYEAALSIDSRLASDAELRSNVIAMTKQKHAVAAVIALELLASRVTPPARDVIMTTASTSPLRDVRQRARAIAERDGYADGIDSFVSLSLDLKQASTCDERREVIQQLSALSDRRAIPALRRAREKYPCIEPDATNAIAHLESSP